MESTRRSALGVESLLMLVVLVASVAAVSYLGNRATVPNVDGWYAEADRPFFTPPDWLFAPVWLTFYAAMAIAAWLAWRARSPLGPWFLQLALNLAWPWTFFAAQWLWFGGIVIIALALAIVLTIRTFWPHSRIAAWLLVPYLGWVLYATALTFGIAALN